jgi:hypothetical protein
MHNAPVKAMDMPVRNPAADAVLRAGVGAVFAAGSVTSKTYLQTVICSPEATPRREIPNSSTVSGPAKGRTT